MRKIFLFIIFFLISPVSADPSKTVFYGEGRNIPTEVYFFDEEGKKVFLDKFEEKTFLLVFWATWCPSCESEMSDLDILQRDFRKLPFEILAVSEDFLGAEAVRKFFSEKGLRSLKIYIDDKNSLFKAFSVVGLPTAFLVNSEGKIKVKFTGLVKWNSEGVRDIILSTIGGNYPKPPNSAKEDYVHFVKPGAKVAEPVDTKKLEEEKKEEGTQNDRSKKN